MSPEPLKLFYCYAHADAKLRKRLDDHLALLKREGVISEWHDGDITAGKPWEEEIHQNLEDAHLILLLEDFPLPYEEFEMRPSLPFLRTFLHEDHQGRGELFLQEKRAMQYLLREKGALT